MLTIVITSYKESQTIGRAIQAFLDENLKEDFEILVVTPDEETQEVVLGFEKKYPQVKCLKEKEKKGKPAALNFAFQETKGKILILSDGDVYIEKGSIEKLLEPFKNPKIGAVSGRPTPINPRNNCFGFWSHLLLDAAHQRRSELSRKEKFFDCSGYLYALRKSLIYNLPAVDTDKASLSADKVKTNSSADKAIFQFSNSTLSEDAYISHLIWQKGYRIAYAPEAKVNVKLPTNFKDWILQKKRSTGGATQKLKIKSEKLKVKKMRSFWQEISWGTKFALKYPKNIRELYWTIFLFFARFYLWILIFWDLKIRKKSFKEIWKPIESTKS